MRPTDRDIAKSKDFRTAMKQWISADGLPVAGETRRRATVAQWHEFYRRTETGVMAACEWLNSAVLGTETETRPAAAAAVKPVTTETKEAETMTETTATTATTAAAAPAVDLSAVAAQIASALAILQAGAGVNVAEVEKIVDRKLATSGAAMDIKLDGVKTGTLAAGAHPVCADVIRWISVDVPVYVYGPAGSGKSSIGRQTAEALGLPLYQYGALLSKYDVLGSINLSGEYQRSAFRDWFEHGGLLVIDEIDGSDPRAIVAINDALRGRAGVSFAFPDQTVQKHPDCRLIVSANTVGRGANAQYVGRFKLDAASLNGFVQIYADYCPKIEKALSRGEAGWLKLCRDVREAAANLKIDLIISPRQIDFGARLLSSAASDDDREQLRAMAINQCLKGGLSDDQWKLIANKVGI